MVTQNMLCTHEGKQVLSVKKYLICDCSRINQKPYTGQITEIAPTCAPFYELPSNKSIMIQIQLGFFFTSITTKNCS